MANVLLAVERKILLLGGGNGNNAAAENAFLQQVAAAYSFQATLNFTVAGFTGFGRG